MGCRLGTVAVVLTLVAAGCSSGGDDQSSPSPTTSPADPPALRCELGTAPAEGEITFVQDGRLMGVDPIGKAGRCLLDEEVAGSWSPTGDRLLVDGAVFDGSGAIAALEGASASDRLVWSRPTGKSILRVDSNGKLWKHPATGGPATDISFLARHDEAVYQGAGVQIITSGADQKGGYGLFLSDNLGKGHVRIADGEDATRIRNLVVVDSVVLFIAEHGATHHLHSLQIEGGTIVDLAEGDGLDAVVPARSTPAWREGACGSGAARVGGVGRELPAEIADGTPIGTLVDGSLVLHDACEPAGVGAVYVLAGSTGAATKIADEVSRVAVRTPAPSTVDEPIDLQGARIDQRAVA